MLRQGKVSGNRMKSFVCLAKIFIYCLVNVLSDDYHCYDKIDDPYIQFSTKTGYRVNQNTNDGEIKLKGCDAKQFWLMSRHGTRNPGEREMKKMKLRLPQIFENIKLNRLAGRGSFCEDDIANLGDWKFLANVTEDKNLVGEGRKELKGLGRRFRKRFPKLLTKPFVNESYKFQHTDSKRTRASAQAFAKGMFDKSNLNVFMTKSPHPDNLLRFDKSCDKWLQEVVENNTGKMEKKKFEKSSDFLDMIKTVSDRLGFTSELSLDEIDLMHSMCSYDKAWRPKNLSPWCAVFSKTDLQILEYRDDLEYYYEDGYGYPINYEQACTPLKDVFENFRQTVNESSSSRPVKGFFYFTHSETMLKFLSRFRLFEDNVRPTHSNRLERTHRLWRTSRIDSFATNIAFVLFKCADDYRVTAYFQEKPIRIPGCSQDLCHFDEFRNQYGLFVEQCNLGDICRV